MTTGNQSEFAKKYGYTQAAISQFKKDGRLVFAANKKVDFEASIKRIMDTSDPQKDYVRDRFKAARANHESNEDQDSEIISANNFQDARALKEKYLALQAKADYEKSMGELIERAEVRRDLAKAVKIIHSTLERIPDFISGEIANSDQEIVHAKLTEVIWDAIKQSSEEFGKI